MSLNLFARKDLRAMLAESEGEKGGLKRSLGPLNLVTLGIGAIIGTGIFVLTGEVAASYAGPAVVISFVIAAVASAFAGLCYAEFSALIPIAGSAYSYGYTTLGEIVAWIIGWALILEYAFGAATVAVGWSGYISSLLANFHVFIPAALTAAPGTDLVMVGDHWIKAASATADQLVGAQHMMASFNLMAFLGILAVTSILVIGIKESANVNTAIVAVKVSVLLVFIGLGVQFLFLSGHLSVATANWHPFIPANTGHFGDFGWSGVVRGAAVIFFAYIGFDAVSTAAQEAKNPKKDMPIGILGSLVICTILYIIVAALTTGLINYSKLKGVAEPIALAVDVTGVRWGSILVKIGAIGGLSSTMLVMLLGQSRIFFTMSSDGLLWKWASKIHPKFRTPYISTIVVGLCVATLAASLPVSTLAELTSIGTLFAFTIVCAGVWILRVREPDLPRPFKTPWVPFVPIMGVLVSLGLMLALHLLTWEVFLGWLCLGLVVYFTYSRYHSRVQLALQNPSGGRP
jgi:APA family basic amino acid/polyamine antiporter